jgi:hypothetical protein
MSRVLRGIVAASGLGLTGTVGYVGHSLAHAHRELDRVWQSNGSQEVNEDADQFLVGLARQLQDELIADSSNSASSSGLFVLTAGRGEPLSDMVHEVQRTSAPVFPVMIELNCMQPPAGHDTTSEATFGDSFSARTKTEPSLDANLRWQLAATLTDSFEQRSAPVPDWLLAVSTSLLHIIDNALDDDRTKRNADDKIVNIPSLKNAVEAVVSLTHSALQLACSPGRLIVSQLLQVDHVQQWLFPSLECSLDVVKQTIERLSDDGQVKLLLCVNDVIPRLARASNMDGPISPSEATLMDLAAKQQKAEQERMFSWITAVLQGK